MFVAIDGKIVPIEEARIPVTNRSFLFGEGLFETVLIYKKQLPFFAEHLARLEWATAFLDLPFPNQEELLKTAKDLIIKNQIEDSGRLKIILSFNGKTMRPTLIGSDNQSQIVISAEKSDPYTQADYQKGVEVALITSIKSDQAPLANVKATNWLTKMVAKKEANEKSCFDGLMINEKGECTETATANFFWIEKNKVYTAPLTSGVLPGITRQIAFDLCEDEEIAFFEKALLKSDLPNIEEAFLTSSFIGIMPICQIGDHTLKSDQPNSISQKLVKAYQDYLSEKVK